MALFAAARGYHRREDKPFWWAHFDRLNNPVDEWGDTSDVFLADDVGEVVKDWHLPSSRARKQQRWVKLTGTLAAGGLDSSVFALYNPPSPAGLTDNPDRRAAGNAEIIDVDDPNIPTEVTICEREPKDGGTFPEVPFALTPGRPFPTGKLRDSIDAAAADVAAGLPTLPDSAIVDILRRRTPRTRSGAPLPHAGETASDITAALLDLDSSYLAVHGPPGTGKTYTAARIIASLVNEHHWRVGVVAQSHAVVENLFRDLIKADVDPARIGKKDSPPDAAWQDVDKDDYAAFIATNDGCVIGGTAWDFANDARVDAGSLDLLVIEEAGQFCLANTIAVARAARNLMLLGDPQQLPQVSQGHHPEPVDASALGWLVDGHRTLPEELGYFLDRSYRMHPAVCGPVSRLSYEGRLRSDESRTAARTLDGYPPGVRVLIVAHDGNSTSSPEEAAVIVAATQRLLGSRVDRRGRHSRARSGRRVGGRAVQRPGAAAARPFRSRRAARCRRRHRRQVPGQAGTGGVRVDDSVVNRRRPARDLLPPQPQSPQRRGEPREVPQHRRPVGDPDRVSAVDAGSPGGAWRVPVAGRL